MKRFMKLCCLLLLILPLTGYASEAAPAAEGEGGGEASKKPLPPPVPNGPDNIETYLHLQVSNMTKAEAPRVQDRSLILTWKGDGQPRYVAAAFQHENWRQKHIFWRNKNGVYFLVYDLTTDTPQQLQYRLIVDGLWQGDPQNPDRIRNDQGIALSRVTLPSAALPAHHGPVLGSFGEVEFVYHGKAGKTVSVIGNFNQWDPFATPLEEVHPGEYHLKVTLPPGAVLYRFVEGTRSFLDPNNLHTGHDDQGMTFSYFENKVTQPTAVLEASMAMAPAHH